MTVQSVTAKISDGIVYGNVTISFGKISATTMGESSILPNVDGNNANYLVVQQAVLSQPSTIQSISIYLSAALGKIRLGVYNFSNAKVAETDEITAVVGWNTAPVKLPVLLVSGTYWLSYFASANVSTKRIDNNGTGKFWWAAYGILPYSLPISTPTNISSHWSLYATVEPAAEIIPDPVFSGPFNEVIQLPPPSGFGLVRSKTSHSSGSWYFEMRVNAAADTSKVGVGIDNGTENLTSKSGQAGSICWMGDGTVNYNGAMGVYSGPPFSIGDVLGINPDLTAKTIRFRVNGGPFSNAFSIQAIVTGPMFALAQLAAPLDQITSNFTGPFAFTPPSTAWG